MKYIVMDLEWNQAKHKEDENKKLPFEIIEIGAVKLNEKFEIIDTFDGLIRPSVYRKISPRATELTGIHTDDLQDKKGFCRVSKEFLEWCQKDGSFVFCTWGTMDLTELQKNMKYFHVKMNFEYPLWYYDIQKLFAIYQGENGERKSLETAVDILHIKKDKEFHRAIEDATYTARIIHEICDYMKETRMSLDYYEIPKNKSEEIERYFEGSNRYVSRGFSTKEEALADRTVASIKCYKCRKKVKKQIQWFSSNCKTYYALGVCNEHGEIRGKLSLRKDRRGKIYAVKACKMASKEDAEKIRKKQKEVKEKKRLKAK